MSADDNLMTALNQYFVSSGEKQSYETGQLTRFYLDGISLVDTMQDRKGDFTLDELIQETGDHGRDTVNESIKKELLVLIKKFLTDTVSMTPSAD
ncbi:hypothetical protein [Absidia glauca]|uniref:Uncharacterized protein n=1 Tax=Absidia glauca TaxID=4829 RepID=A0A163MB89_ABSGL|nr:hypothetical protein [Absidia glauca]